jgi:hypothetical protein
VFNFQLDFVDQSLEWLAVVMAATHLWAVDSGNEDMLKATWCMPSTCSHTSLFAGSPHAARSSVDLLADSFHVAVASSGVMEVLTTIHPSDEYPFPTNSTTMSARNLSLVPIKARTGV